MTLANTVDVVWRPTRDSWVVEGGNGRTAVLGIQSLHESKADAVEAAAALAEEHDAHIRILNEPGDGWPHREGQGTDGESAGTNADTGAPDVR